MILFGRSPATSAQCIIGAEKYLDPVFVLNYDDDEYSQRNGQIKEALRALTKDDVFKTYVSEHVFISSIIINDIGYTLKVFDMRYQKYLKNAQPIKVEFTF